jgi:hypothetical protein
MYVFAHSHEKKIGVALLVDFLEYWRCSCIGVGVGGGKT